MKQVCASTAAFSRGFWPRTRTVPEVGRSWAVMSDMVTVFPAPLRPSRPVMALRRNVRFRFSTAVMAPKRLVTPSN